MDDNALLKFALVFSLVGIISLWFFSEIIELEEIPIGKINLENIGEEIKIRGIVNNVKDFEKFLIIDVEDKQGGVIPVLIFKDGNLEIDRNSEVSISGEVKEYNGKIELIGEEVKLIKSYI